MSLSPEAVPVMPRGVRLHFDRVRGSWVLLAPERAVQLDAIGHAILSEVDGAKPFAEIVGTLAARYAAPEAEIDGDCDAFLSGLVEKRFLDLAP